MIQSLGGGGAETKPVYVILLNAQLIMDAVKLEPDSDSDCHQMSSVNDGSVEGMKEEQRTLSENTSEVKVGDASA